MMSKLDNGMWVNPAFIETVYDRAENVTVIGFRSGRLVNVMDTTAEAVVKQALGSA